MARYTDIDLLIDKVEETTWYHINKNGELVNGANSKTDIPLYKHSDIKRVLAEAPTADVAPKREVERLERILNSYALQYGTVVDQQKVIEKAKTEVAREVISEFKAMLKLRMMKLGIYPVALHRSLEHIEKKLTEKYMEGNNEKKTE